MDIFLPFSHYQGYTATLLNFEVIGTVTCWRWHWLWHWHYDSRHDSHDFHDYYDYDYHPEVESIIYYSALQKKNPYISKLLGASLTRHCDPRHEYLDYDLVIVALIFYFAVQKT